MPKITFVIPAKNAQKTLAETLTSLVSQTFKDFNVIIVDDGSTDQTALIAQTFQEKLPIKIISHPESEGVAKSINDGIMRSDSEFVARLDADDTAHPLRLQKQLDFFESNQKTGICGSQMNVFSDDGLTHYVLSHPTSSASIKTALIQRCVLAHPSLLIRRSVFEIAGLYDVNFDYAEDYDLWCRASLLGIQFANINEQLTNYRIHSGQVSNQKSQLQQVRDLAIKKKYISAFLDGDDPEELPKFLSLTNQYENKITSLNAYLKCGKNILQLAKNIPDTEEYHRIIFGSLIRHLNQ
jgi:glycosyltransferase involved in cell wall biosynthesis